MAAKTVLILGGGLGGVVVANHLRRQLGQEHAVVLIERKPTFSLPMANLWLMTGERADDAEGVRDLSALLKKGIEFVQAEILSFDPNQKVAETTAGTFRGDFAILALGAQRAPEALPGFAEAALNLYERSGATAIQRALADFTAGRIVVLVSRTPFSCPSAPYEAAFLVDEQLRKRGVRASAEIAVYTPEDLPMPVTGAAVGNEMVAMLRERNIEFHPEQIALKIDAKNRKVLFEIDETRYDVLIGVPPHVAPRLARESHLTDAAGWIPVDQGTLATRFDGVFAIGDVTAIPLANGMYLPKAGVFADGEARVVAQTIAAAVNDAQGGGRYDGQGSCYIEVGDGAAAYGAGNFYSLPAPRVILEQPAARFRKEKLETERDALALFE